MDNKCETCSHLTGERIFPDCPAWTECTQDRDEFYNDGADCPAYKENEV